MTHRPSTRPARGRGDDGAALVELAIALPLLVMLVFGIYAVGQGYHAKTELTGAVREGVRAAALQTGARDDAAVKQRVLQASPGLTPDPSVTVDKWCAGTNASTDAQVTVRYSVRYTIPFVSNGTWDIDEIAVMRCGL